MAPIPQPPLPEEIRKARQAVDQVAHAAGRTALAYVIYRQVSDGDMIIDNRGKVTRVAQIDRRTRKPTGRIITDRMELDQAVHEVAKHYEALFKKSIQHSLANREMSKGGIEILLLQPDNLTENIHQEGDIVRRNSQRCPCKMSPYTFSNCPL